MRVAIARRRAKEDNEDRLRSIFWLAMGGVFFIAGNLRKPIQTK